jgi:hypothetical protein
MGAPHLNQAHAQHTQQRHGSGKRRFERQTHDKHPLITLAFLESGLPAPKARQPCDRCTANALQWFPFVTALSTSCATLRRLLHHDGQTHLKNEYFFII